MLQREFSRQHAMRMPRVPAPVQRVGPVFEIAHDLRDIALTCWREVALLAVFALISITIAAPPS